MRRRNGSATNGSARGAVDAPAEDAPPAPPELAALPEAIVQLIEYETSLAQYNMAVQPRTPVPSDREIASGRAPEGFEFKPTPPPPPPPRQTALGRIATVFRGLNPRTVKGDVKPLLIVTLITVTGMWDEIGFGFLIFFIKVDMNFDFEYLSTILTVFAVVTRLAGPLAGYVADRVKRVWMVGVGALLANGLTMLAGLAPSAFLLGASRVGGAIGRGIEQPAADPLLADYYTVEDRVKVFAFRQAASAMAASIGVMALIGSFIFIGISWRVILLTVGGLSTIATLLLLTLKEPVRGAADRKSMGASDEVANVEAKPVSWAEAWRTLSSIGTLRRLWYSEPFIATAQVGLPTFMFFVLQAKMAGVTDLGPGGSIIRSQIGQFIFLAVPGVLGVIGIAFATPVAERLMRHRPGKIMVMAGGAMAFQAVSMLLFIACPWLLAAMVFSWITSAITQLVLPAQYTLLSAVVPARVRGQGMKSHAPWGILGIVILPVLGRFADSYGPTMAAYGLIPVFLAGAFILGTGATSVERDIRAAMAASMADEEARAARRRGANKMIICRDVDVTYDGTQVLFNVDFDVAEGELVALLGTNGAGKSTLLRAICGTQEASNGAVFLDGEDVTHKPPYENAKDGIVFVPGGRAIFPTLTVEENLRAASWMYRDDTEYLHGRVEEVLDFFPVLRERLDVEAGNMSGGEQQMLALSQAFLMKPRLLMIDELSLGLAPAVVEKLLDIVRAIHAQGTTVILVEQSVNVALTVAERAVFMDKGEIRFDGPTEELLKRGDIVRSVFLGGVDSGRGRITTIRHRLTPAGDVEQALGVSGVSVSYGGVRALDDVDLEVNGREIVGIIGPNGAGKTTLFDIVSGFLAPDAGSILLHGEDVTELSPDARARAGLARSFQSTRLFPSLTTRENLAIAVGRRRAVHNPVAAAAWLPLVRRSERRVFQRVDNLIELFGLGAFADKFVNELSTGSRRLVDIACITAVEPKLLLLDEPSSGLAQAEIEVLGPVVQRLAAETGCGVLVIEHDIPLVASMATRMYAMELGRVIAAGPPDEVLADANVRSAYLAASQSVINRSGDRLAKALAAIEDIVQPEYTA